MEPTLLLATADRLAGEALVSALNTEGYRACFHGQHLSNIDRYLAAHHPSFVLIGEALIYTLGEQLYAAVRTLDYRPRCAFILSSGSAGHVVGGLQNGVAGFIHKSAGLQDMMRCLQALGQGRMYISPDLSGPLPAGNGHKGPGEALGQAELTCREEEILQLLRHNKTSREIGAALNLSPKTIQNHRQNMCNKLGLEGRNSLFEYALRHAEDG